MTRVVALLLILAYPTPGRCGGNPKPAPPPRPLAPASPDALATTGRISDLLHDSGADRRELGGEYMRRYVQGHPTAPESRLLMIDALNSRWDDTRTAGIGALERHAPRLWSAGTLLSVLREAWTRYYDVREVVVELARIYYLNQPVPRRERSALRSLVRDSLGSPHYQVRELAVDLLYQHPAQLADLGSDSLSTVRYPELDRVEVDMTGFELGLVSASELRSRAPRPLGPSPDGASAGIANLGAGQSSGRPSRPQRPSHPHATQHEQATPDPERVTGIVEVVIHADLPPAQRERLRIRATPGGAVLGSAACGETFELLGPAEEGFFPIHYLGRRAYISAARRHAVPRAE